MDEPGHPLLFGRGQGQVAEVGQVFPAGVKDQGIVAVHSGGIGQGSGVLGDGYGVAGGPQKVAQDGRGFGVRMASPGYYQQFHGVLPPMIGWLVG